MSDLELFDLDPRDFVSAPAQGALAIQMRAGENTEAVTKVLHHEHTAKNIHVEREILRGINGGCQVPFGAFCEWNEKNEQHELSLFSMMDGKPFFAQHFSESTEKLIQLGLKDVLK